MLSIILTDVGAQGTGGEAPPKGADQEWLAGLVSALSPLFEERSYSGGGLLAREGDPAEALFYVESGTVQICFPLRVRPDEDLVDDAVHYTAHPKP